MTDPLNIFDRAAIRRHRDRAAAGMDQHDFLLREVGQRLADRLQNIKRRFPRALDLGCHRGELGKILVHRDDIECIVNCDPSFGMVALSPEPRLVADEDALPFQNNCFDLVMSLLSLHWVNDLPGALIQVARCLKSDGLFLAAMFGGETLVELRRSLIEAEVKTRGRAYPRVSPFVNIRDLGNLLQRADFTMPVVDIDQITVTYPNTLALMTELRGMGESNAIHQRPRHFTARSTLQALGEFYPESTSSPDGRISAVFQIVYLTAWKKHTGQPRPLSPGSAKTRLADALGAIEQTTGAISRSVLQQK